MILVASDCPALQKSEIENLAGINKSKVHEIEGNSHNLASALGINHKVRLLVIIDPGESDILITFGH